jgi:hypothetical protein
MPFPRRLVARPACLLTKQWQESEHGRNVTRYSGADGLLYQFVEENGWFAVEQSDKQILKELHGDCDLLNDAVMALDRRVRIRDLAEHISTDEMELYHLGKIAEGPDLERIEEHLLWCQECLDRVEAVEHFIDMVRAGVIRGGFDRDDA